MKRITRLPAVTASAVAAALLLTACGGEEAPEEQDTDSTAAEEAPETDTDIDESTEAPEGAGEEGAGEEGAGEQGATRTVTDATGTEVEVPSDPQQVVTLHYAATQPMYDLGLMPVGQGEFTEGIVPEDVLPELANVPVVTSQGEPMLEDIALLEPDLVLAPNTTEEDTLEQLRQVAPVYTFALRGGDRADWQQRTREVADAINRTEGLTQLQDDFEARQQEIAETYADEISGTSVAVIGSFEENNLYVWGEDNMTGTILMPLGFTYSEQANAIVAGEDEPEVTVSFEKVGTAIGDADLILYDSDLRGEISAFTSALIESPLFLELPAVQAGNAYASGKNTIAGYSDANYLLDRVESILAGEG